MNDATDTDDPIRVAFVCVRNAGRSQMAAAFAERERERRGLGDRVEVLSGGTDSAESVHEGVLEAMDEVGVDLSDRTPRAITDDELRSCDYVATMGCSTLSVDAVESRDWALDDPGGKESERVREIRDEVRRRVVALFDEIGGSADR